MQGLRIEVTIILERYLCGEELVGNLLLNVIQLNHNGLPRPEKA